MPKTGAREIAMGLLFLWGLATARMFLMLPSETVSEYNSMYGTMTLAIFTFLTSAFGMKVYANVSQSRQMHEQPRLPPDLDDVSGAG